jgi:hypothetical protein
MSTRDRPQHSLNQKKLEALSRYLRKPAKPCVNDNGSLAAPHLTSPRLRQLVARREIDSIDGVWHMSSVVVDPFVFGLEPGFSFLPVVSA